MNGSFCHFQLLQPWRHGQPQHTGVHLGWRRESRWRDGEQVFHAREQLGGGGEQAIVAAAGLGGDAIRHFALHHDDRALNVLVELQDSQHDVGSYVVGQISHYIHGIGLGGAKIVQGTRPASDHGSKFRGHKIRLQNLNVGPGGISHAQLRRQHVVQLDSNDVPGARQQQVGQHAASGTDFDHRTIRHIAQRLDDAPRHAGVDQKVLS